jgi:hypothetical protein
MAGHEVHFKIPGELIENIPDLSGFAYRSFVLGLFLDEEISLGRAAKLLGMTYDEFINFLGERGIPYFRNTPEEIDQALQKLKPLTK